MTKIRPPIATELAGGTQREEYFPLDLINILGKPHSVMTKQRSQTNVTYLRGIVSFIADQNTHFRIYRDANGFTSFERIFLDIVT